MTTNIPKSAVTKSTSSKSDRLTWSDSSITWASAIYRWGVDGKLPSNVPKASVTITNVTKS